MKQHEELHKHRSSKKLQQIALNINNEATTEEFCITNQFDKSLRSVASKLVEKVHISKTFSVSCQGQIKKIDF